MGNQSLSIAIVSTVTVAIVVTGHDLQWRSTPTAVVAPSTELRQRFGHRVERWAEFRRRYRKELDGRPGVLTPIINAAKRRNITLLYSAHDVDHNGAVVLRDYLMKRTRCPSQRSHTSPIAPL